jgi:hypothetical protein
MGILLQSISERRRRGVAGIFSILLHSDEKAAYSGEGFRAIAFEIFIR